MTYFLPSYFQKRILRYALSRLDLLDAEKLNLDNLDIAWGRQSVIELRDVGLQLKKLSSILQLSPRLVLSKAKIKVLRVTVPADLHTSGILAEIDGAEIELRVDTSFEQDPETVAFKSEKDEYQSAQRRTSGDQPRSLRPKVHDPGGGPASTVHLSDPQSESTSPASLPTTDDLAKSFLQAEPQREKAELQAAVAKSQQLDESDIFDDSNQGATVGVGNGLSLPGFLSGFLKGIEERFRLNIQNLLADVILDVELATEGPLAPTTGDGSEKVTLRISIQNLEYLNVPLPDYHANNEIDGSVRSNESASLDTTSGTKSCGRARRLRCSNIRGEVLSDAATFSSLLPSPAPSSSSESTVAGSPSIGRRRSQHSRYEVMAETRIRQGEQYALSRSPTSSVTSGGLHDLLSDLQPMPSKSHDQSRSRPNSISAFKQHFNRNKQIFDDSNFDSGRDKHRSENTYDFQNSLKQLPLEPLVASADVSHHTAINEVSHRSSKPPTPAERQFSQREQHHLAQDSSTTSTPPELQQDSSPANEDLTESRLFTHEEAESMYMSAMSNLDAAGQLVDQVVPGAWAPHLEGEGTAEHPLGPTAMVDSQPKPELEFCEPALVEPESEGGSIAPSLPATPGVSKDPTDRSDTDAIPLEEASTISRSKERSPQPLSFKTSDASETTRETTLTVSKLVMFIDNISLDLPYFDADPASSISPHADSPTARRNIRVAGIRSEDPASSSSIETPFSEQRMIRDGSRLGSHSPEASIRNPASRTATSVKIGTATFNTDMGLARLTALIAKQISKAFPSTKSTRPKSNGASTESYSETKMLVEQVKWGFYDRIVGSPAVEASSSSPQIGIEGTFDGSELLLSATLQNLESSAQTTASAYRSRISTAKMAFGYASGDIISFDRSLKMRESTGDILAPERSDMVLTISKDARASKIELTTLPVHVRLDLRRLDETFAWLGGFSSILDLGNSMISTVTTLESKKSKTQDTQRSSRGVHFESPSLKMSARNSAAHDPLLRKVTARVGGLTCELLGSESSLRIEMSALKAVSRTEGLGLQVDRMNVKGLYLKSVGDQPVIVAQLSNLRMEYLSQPKEVDLARLLALLSPSRDKYEIDDDILLDTLLRQRRQGGVVRLTAERSDTRIEDFSSIQHFCTLAEELKKLATVTKYLPEDDRPGILTLGLIRQMRCEAMIGGSLGLIEAELSNIELAHVTLPSLVALGVARIHVCRNGSEGLVAPATQVERPDNGPLPMIMARFIGNEMEPTVKVKLYNTSVEYHVPFIAAVMDKTGNLQPEDLLTDIAGSVASLTARERWKGGPPVYRHDDEAPSGTASSNNMTLKIDVVIRDSLVGLNPSKSPAKGIVMFSETRFAGMIPRGQEANAILDIRKAVLMVVDDQKTVKRLEVDAKRPSLQPNASQLQVLESMGYVSISSISAASAVLQIVHDAASSTRSIDIEIKDDLFVIESCADSSQTIQTIVNNLAPPLPPSKEIRYRTEVVPIEDMLSSFSGMAFTSNGRRLEDDEEDPPSPEHDEKIMGDEDLPDLDVGSSFHDLEPSRSYDGVSDSMLDEESDSVVVDPSAQTLEGNTSLADSYDQRQEEVEGALLEFRDDHFGSSSSVGGTAHRWNTEQNTYGLPNEAQIQRSPLKVRVRDVHVIWNLFDGYDWQRTRETISEAIANIENKALNRQSKREKRKPQEDDEDEESVIGDFLFNSIYIGIPANKDPRNLSRQISRNLDDIESESESSVPSTLSSSTSRPNTASPARIKRPRLARSRHHKMTFELKGISADLVVFPPGSGETQSSLDVRVQDLEIFDHVPTSTWKKFATYMQDAGERESGSSMIHLEVLTVRPVADLAASEMILKATILPLRLHVDQDALDFMTRFFEFKDDSVKVAAIKSEAAFLQRVEVNSVRLRLDFKPKRVDYAGIRSGHTNEFMNFFILDRADMVLRHVIIYGIAGFDRLGKTLNDIWMPDIKRNQLPGVLAGLAPVRSLVNVGSGVRDLVVIPIQEYQKDGRIVRSLQKGALAFAKTTTSELVKLGAKLAIGTQTVLQGAEDLLTQPEQQRQEVSGGWEDAELDEDEKKHISLYADQPVGVVQGLRGAYASLERDLLTAKDAIVAMPGEVMESGTAGGAAKAVLKGAPTIILRPALGVSKAVGRTLMGATNSLDPENRRRIEEKYKKH